MFDYKIMQQAGINSSFPKWCAQETTNTRTDCGSCGLENNSMLLWRKQKWNLIPGICTLVIVQLILLGKHFAACWLKGIFG